MASEIKVVKFLNGVKTFIDHGSPSIDLILKKIRTPESESNLSGADITLPSPLTSFVKMTNPLLESILNIDPATDFELLIIHNDTGVPIIIKGTGNIILGIDNELTMELGASILLYHIPSLDKYAVIGGSGGGGGSAQKKYQLNNNQALSSIAGLVLDSSKYTSYFVRFEVERIGGVTYRQIIEAKAVYNGSTWGLFFGSYAGADIVQTALSNTYEITLAITGVGQIQYSSGNLSAHVKSNLKVILEGLKV